MEQVLGRANAMSTSPEEIIRLRLELKIMLLPPTSLVEWCSTCTSTRLVRLVLPEEEHEVQEAVVQEDVKEETKVVEVEKASCCEATALDACTQTPQRRWKRKQNEETSCLSVDADQEERIASISSAHHQGDQFQVL